MLDGADGNLGYFVLQGKSGTTLTCLKAPPDFFDRMICQLGAWMCFAPRGILVTCDALENVTFTTSHDALGKFGQSSRLAP